MRKLQLIGGPHDKDIEALGVAGLLKSAFALMGNDMSILRPCRIIMMTTVIMVLMMMDDDG